MKKDLQRKLKTDTPPTDCREGKACSAQVLENGPLTGQSPQFQESSPLSAKFQALSHGSKDSLQEAISYLLTGGATTLVNYVAYLALLHFKVGYLTANTVAWVFAVAFAYVSNRVFVFHSENQIGKELASFVSMRFLTLLMENLLLILFIQYFQFHPALSKIAVSFATVIANYIICKCQIFRKPAGYLPTPVTAKGEETNE